MLQNLKIRHKLMLILLAPLLGLLVFCVREVETDYALLRDVQGTEALVRLDVQIGELCHELQKERGYSSGYLNTNGEKFRSELVAQRRDVDATLQRVTGYLAANAEAVAPVKSSLDAAEGALVKLSEVRGAISGVSLSPADSYGYYTGLIASLLEVTAAAATGSAHPEIMRQATAYYAFVMAKEATGKERATLNAVLGHGRFDTESLQRSYVNLAAQLSYLDVFRKYGSHEAVALYKEKEGSPPFAEVEEQRNTLMAHGISGDFSITPEEWFATITRKIDGMKEIEDFQARHILESAASLAERTRQDLLFSIGLASVLTAFALGVGFAVMRSITAPLKRMLHMLQDVAEGEGDLTKRLAVGRRDELGEVSLWFNRFVENVNGIVTQVSATATSVSQAVHTMNSTAEQIASTVDQVAGQAAGLSTAGEEMSATATDISRTCLAAAAASDRAGETARGGELVVLETLAGMQRIATRVQASARTVSSLGERSEQIGAIVDTIEDIADQTNLLALNAAIEAARAGEQGRGFAVVADEVRALAERTTRATREIAAMIKAIQGETATAVASMEQGIDEVEKGTQSSRRSGTALQEIVEVIDAVNLQVQQIATAAEEQTAVISEMSGSIHQISEVVCETSRGARRTSEAAAGLESLAEDLQRMIGRFKLA